MTQLMHLNGRRIVVSFLMDSEQYAPGVSAAPELIQIHTQRRAGPECLEPIVFGSDRAAEGEGCQPSPSGQKPVSPFVSRH